MPLLKKWNYKGAVFGIWRVTETQEELMDLLSGFSYVDCEIAQYKSVSRRMEYLAVRVLLKELTGRAYKILHRESGKPYIEGEEQKISISHTKGYVAVGLHPFCETGIDIEYYSERVKKVAARFVRNDEAEYIGKICGDADLGNDTVYKLLLLWSAKETLYKTLSMPEVDLKEHMRVYPFVIDMLHDFPIEGVMKSCEYKTASRYVYSIAYMMYADFVCTYCVAD